MKDDTPSATACIVALGCLCAPAPAASPEPAASPAPASPRRSHSAWDPRVASILRELLSAPGVPFPWRALAALTRAPLVGTLVRTAVRRTMDLAIPGMFAYYVARKQFIESRVRGFLAELSGSARGESSQGVSLVVAQVVVLGGGFDTLAKRLADDFPGTRVLEIDHPATQKAKRQGLERLGSLTPNLSLVAADLARVPLVDVLSTSGFNARLPTAYVIEGILMYLEESTVIELFGTLASVGPSDALCVFTAMTSRRDGTVGFEGGRAARVDAWLARQREQFVWGIAPGNIGEFLAKTGWSLIDSPSVEHLAAEAGFERSEVAGGEFVYVARLSVTSGPGTGSRKNPRQ